MKLTHNLYIAKSDEIPKFFLPNSLVITTDTEEILLFGQDRTASTLGPTSKIFLDSTTGLGGGSETADVYRTGLTGFGESSPEELVDIKGNQSSDTGAFKFEYTYDSGAVAKMQLGGRNVLSEVGVPQDAIEANVFDFFGTGVQDGYRGYMYVGDISAINGALGDLSIGLGIDTLVSNQSCVYTVFTSIDDTEFVNRSINTHSSLGFSYITQRADLTTGDHANEKIIRFEFNGANSADMIMNPYWVQYTDAGFLIEELGNGNAVVGETYTHPAGTKTIGATAYSIGVDSQGFLHSIDGSFAGTTPASSGAAGNAGEIRVDGSYIYRYNGSAWERAALTFATW